MLIGTSLPGATPLKHELLISHRRPFPAIEMATICKFEDTRVNINQVIGHPLIPPVARATDQRSRRDSHDRVYHRRATPPSAMTRTFPDAYRSSGLVACGSAGAPRRFGPQVLLVVSVRGCSCRFGPRVLLVVWVSRTVSRRGCTVMNRATLTALYLDEVKRSGAHAR